MRKGDIDVNIGSTGARSLRHTKGSRVTISDLQLTLRRLGFDRPGQVFWLTTDPEVTDAELALRFASL